MKAMILAAGLGTRLRPLTNHIPKALIEVNGVTLLEMVIKRFIQAGFQDIIINVHYLAQTIIDFLKEKDHFGINITISHEVDLLLDTGGGLNKAAWFFDDDKPFLLHNVDILADFDLKELYDSHIKSKALATLVVRDNHSGRNLLFNQDNLLRGWENKKTGERKLLSAEKNGLISKGFCGIHFISPELLPLITEQGVFSIIDLYLRLASDYPIKAIEPEHQLWMDIGSKESLKLAENKLYLKVFYTKHT